jgi:hypothetical protein
MKKSQSTPTAAPALDELKAQQIDAQNAAEVVVSLKRILSLVEAPEADAQTLCLIEHEAKCGLQAAMHLPVAA